MGLFKIQTTIWYDTHEQCYFNALTINGMPKGKLAELIVRKNRPKISPFDTMSASSSTSKYDRPLSLDSNSTYNQNHTHTHTCPYLIYSPNKDRALSENDYDWLLSFLVENDYTIDYQMTKMIMSGFRNSNSMNTSGRILCFFRDNENQ